MIFFLAVFVLTITARAHVATTAVPPSRQLNGKCFSAEMALGPETAQVPANQHTGAKSLIVLFDGIGNITALIDGNQNIVARYEYDPFGRLIGQWGSMADANRYRFSSKEFDTVTGLYYYGRRFYEPTFQRWLNHDPIGENGGLNLYSFNRNNPLRFVDPFGLTVYYSDTPLPGSPFGSYGPYTQTVNDGSDAVLPAVPYLTDAQGLQSTDLDFLPFFLPEIPAVSKALDAAGDALGNLGKDALDKMGLGKPKVSCPTKALPKVDPNKMNHVFGNPGHNLGPLLSNFGGDQNAAFAAIQQAMQAAADAQGIQGVFQGVAVQVGNQTVTVSGNVINGVVNIGTAYR